MIRSTIYQIKSGLGKEQWKAAVQEIGPKIRKGDLVVFYANFMQQCWDHYALGYDHRVTKDFNIPEYQAYGIPRTRNDQIFKEHVKNVISAAQRMDGPHNSLWMFYSHVGDASRLDSLLKSSRLREIDGWSGHGIVMKCYGKNEKLKDELVFSDQTPEARLNANNDTFVRSLYYSILDRRHDEAGVRYWKQSLDRGKSRAWIITQFFNSPEYLSKHKNNTEYVRDLYQGVLGRQPDPGELSHWVNRLNSGNSRQFVLNGFINSKEYRSRTSKGQS